MHKKREMIIFDGKIHLATSLSLLYFLSNTGIQIDFFIITGATIGSYLPDSDIKSPAGKILPLWLFFGHRKHIHSLVSLIIFSILGMILNLNFGIGVSLGFALHLFLDSFTPMGLPYLMYPQIKKYKKYRYK
jgi:membrane-bound metal-dependent hydrolase YbcI (DUF457 family)